MQGNTETQPTPAALAAADAERWIDGPRGCGWYIRPTLRPGNDDYRHDWIGPFPSNIEAAIAGNETRRILDRAIDSALADERAASAGLLEAARIALDALSIHPKLGVSSKHASDALRAAIARCEAK